jgi:hypothetical protein
MLPLRLPLKRAGKTRAFDGGHCRASATRRLFERVRTAVFSGHVRHGNRGAAPYGFTTGDGQVSACPSQPRCMSGNPPANV